MSPLRLLHTADWHLGHSLHELPRHHEHAAFLAWLLETLEEKAIDLLLIAGDVFDTHNPSAQAQAQWYGFLAEATARCPQLQVLAIAGNHDSAERLAAPAPLLHRHGVRVVGALPKGPEGRLACEELVFPVKDAGGEVAAWVVAMPFLRPVDLPPGENLAAGVGARYAEALAFAEAQAQPHQALVAMGHAYLAHTTLSELSERKVLGGNQHALPSSLFPESLAYVALGHLHLAQEVGREGIRYSGSPIPLSMTEAHYEHQVLLVELEGPRLASVKALQVPRSVPFLRLPEGGPLPLPMVLDCVAALADRPVGMADHERPFLELRVRLDGPEPRLTEQLAAALEGKAARLVRLVRERARGPETQATPGQDLRQLQPEAVFRLRHERVHGKAPDAALLGRFHALLAAAQEAEA